MTALSLALALLVMLVLFVFAHGGEKVAIPFLSQEGDVAMSSQTGKPVEQLLSKYGAPDRREPFTWQNHQGELWSYVRTTIATNSAKRPSSLACVRQFYVHRETSEVRGTWSSGFCRPPYNTKVLDTLTLPGKP